MPFYGNSPEAGLRRSDSKNPHTTCRGVTVSGEACRNPIGTSARNSPNVKGFKASLSHAAGIHSDPTVHYCRWHKDQARQADSVQLEGRASMDTLMGRLGILSIQEETPTKPKRKPKGEASAAGLPVKQTKQRQQWQETPGPLLATPNNSFPPNSNAATNARPRPSQPVRRRGSHYHFSISCCAVGAHDSNPPARPRPSRPPLSGQPPQTSSIPNNVSLATPSGHRPSQTAILKSWIPDSVTPATHTALMTELAKPLSQQDRETGYIYMFWETPVDAPQPTRELTRSLMHDVHDVWKTRGDLLADPWSAVKTGQGILSTSEALKTAVLAQGRTNPQGSSPTGRNPPSESLSMMLKIGRAENVQRRMNEWNRQCGRNITLLRFYPYVSRKAGSASPSPARASDRGKQRVSDANLASSHHPGPVANCPRVERLIHVELAGQRVMKQCDTCGRQHREWFAVPATREGVQKVDETIKRWIRWGEERGKEESVNRR